MSELEQKIRNVIKAWQSEDELAMEDALLDLESLLDRPAPKLTTEQCCTEFKQWLQGHLSSLLAIIHRDGGHYERDHGTDKAVEDAKKLLTEHYLPSVQSPILNTEPLKGDETETAKTPEITYCPECGTALGIEGGE